MNPPYILCATDFSDHATDAATVAAKLALRRAEKLQLVHVIDGTSVGTLAATRKRLDTECRRLRRCGADVETVMLEGAGVGRMLLGHIRGHEPSLVVVSTGASGAGKHWVAGSFAESIAESSPVPTLVVRDPAAFESWDWTRERLRVLLAVDRYATSDVVLRWARHFCQAGPCDLVSCYVNWRIPSVEEAAVAPGRPVNPPALQSRLERELRRRVRDQIGEDDGAVVVRPQFGEAAPCLAELAGERRSQLIAVGTHQRRGIDRLIHDSVSRELLRHATVNVVCVPLTARFDPRQAHIPAIRRVLVATDFSALGNAAVPLACAACGPGGLVKLVYVAPAKERLSPAARRDGAESLHERLRLLIPDEMGSRWQPPEVEVLASRDVAEAICAEAERFGADLVCLASHGFGVSRALHGSVAKAVLNKIRRPLLIFRQAE